MKESEVEKRTVIDYEGAWKELDKMLREQTRLANLMLPKVTPQIENPMLNMMDNILAEFINEEPVQ